MKLKPSITLPLFLLILFYFQTEIYAQTSAFPRFLPDPKALEYFYLGENDVYSWTSLAEISLWASGDTGAANLERIKTIAQTIKNSPNLPNNNKDIAEFVLNYMHKNILRSYSLYQTRIDTLLSTGRYNCVSSSFLYSILCESLGIKTFGVVTRDHAFVIIPAGETEIDVETTTAYGFDPGNRREFHDQFGKVTGFTYVPAGNYRDRETISPLQLISLILNNRIAEMERQRRWADAVPIAVDRAALLLGDLSGASEKKFNFIFTDPRKDLHDRLFNYAASLLRSNREEDCLRWAMTASPLYPDEERWQESIMAAVNNRITRFFRERKINDAEIFLENNKLHLTQVNYAQLNSIIKNNKAVDYHNRFAAAWNRRNYDEAERILNEGLAEFPESRQLLSDKQILEKQRAN